MPSSASRDRVRGGGGGSDSGRRRDMAAGSGWCPYCGGMGGLLLWNALVVWRAAVRALCLTVILCLSVRHPHCAPQLSSTRGNRGSTCQGRPPWLEEDAPAARSTGLTHGMRCRYTQHPTSSGSILLLSRSLTQVELPRPALSAVSNRRRSSSGECPCLPIAPLGGPLPFLSVTNARVVLLGPLVYLFALHCPGWQTTSSAQCGEAITVLVTVFRPRAEFPPFLFFFFVFLSDVPRTLPSTKRPPTTTLSTLYSTVLIQKASSRQGLNTCMDPTQE